MYAEGRRAGRAVATASVPGRQCCTRPLEAQRRRAAAGAGAQQASLPAGRLASAAPAGRAGPAAGAGVAGELARRALAAAAAVAARQGCRAAGADPAGLAAAAASRAAAAARSAASLCGWQPTRRSSPAPALAAAPRPRPEKRPKRTAAARRAAARRPGRHGLEECARAVKGRQHGGTRQAKTVAAARRQPGGRQAGRQASRQASRQLHGRRTEAACSSRAPCGGAAGQRHQARVRTRGSAQRGCKGAASRGQLARQRLEDCDQPLGKLKPNGIRVSLQQAGPGLASMGGAGGASFSGAPYVCTGINWPPAKARFAVRGQALSPHARRQHRRSSFTRSGADKQGRGRIPRPSDLQEARPLQLVRAMRKPARQCVGGAAVS